MATIDVQDAAGVTRTIDILGTVPDNGRAAATGSRPVALSTEDLAAVNAVTAKMEEVRALVAGTDTQLPATLGPKTGANSLSTVLATDATLPLPTGAATAAGVAEVRDRLPSALVGGRLSVGARVLSYDYPISTANSSTAQLAAGASFTGTIESIQDQPSISILLTSDQPITLTVRQFIDVAGTFAVPDIVFFVPAGQGFARSLTINGNFVRIIAQNTGSATTTTFNLNTAFGTLGDADTTGTTPVTELPLVLTGAAAQTAVVNNILSPAAGAAGLNVSGYRAAAVQVVSTGTGGTFIFEQSNDGTNWRPLPVFNAELVTAVPITAAITATASQIIYTFPVRCNFLRLRIATTITGGSIQAFTRLSTEPWTPAAQLVASSVAANLNATVSGTVTANIGTGSIAAGTNAIGDVGLQARANATGAASIHHVVSAATTNVAQVKATAGRVLGWFFVNNTATWRYVKLHNVASATAGTGVVQTIGVPPNGVAAESLPIGLGFSTAISRSIVTGAADADATATGANEVVGDIFFA